MAPDVWEHFSPFLESTGVINYKFWNALEMTFLHLVHSHFSVFNRWGVIKILVIISEARIRYRKFSHNFACKFFSASWNILILKRVQIVVFRWNEPSDWVSDACTEGVVFFEFQNFVIVVRYDLGILYYLSKILIIILPWVPRSPRCSKN